MTRKSELPGQGVLLTPAPNVIEPLTSTMGSHERINRMARNRKDAAANAAQVTTTSTEIAEIAPAGSLIFKIGTPIWLESGPHGILQSDIMADKIGEGIEVKNLTGYVSRSPGETFYNGHTRQFSIGDRFGAYAKTAKRNRKKLR